MCRSRFAVALVATSGVVGVLAAWAAPTQACSGSQCGPNLEPMPAAGMVPANLPAFALSGPFGWPAGAPQDARLWRTDVAPEEEVNLTKIGSGKTAALRPDALVAGASYRLEYLESCEFADADAGAGSTLTAAYEVVAPSPLPDDLGAPTVVQEQREIDDYEGSSCYVSVWANVVELSVDLESVAPAWRHAIAETIVEVDGEPFHYIPGTGAIGELGADHAPPGHAWAWTSCDETRGDRGALPPGEHSMRLGLRVVGSSFVYSDAVVVDLQCESVRRDTSALDAMVPDDAAVDGSAREDEADAAPSSMHDAGSDGAAADVAKDGSACAAPGARGSTSSWALPLMLVTWLLRRRNRKT